MNATPLDSMTASPTPPRNGAGSGAASGSGRRPRSDRLLHYGVDPAHARVVKHRIGPLTRYYWQRQGLISIEELCMSAYIQGMLDGAQLPKDINE